MAKAGSAARSEPSETLMTMFEYDPTLVSVGVPYSVPVVASKVAQAGLPEMLKVSGSPSGSEAVGRKEYGRVATAEVTGVPLMVGARLVSCGPSTARTNEGRDVTKRP